MEDEKRDKYKEIPVSMRYAMDMDMANTLCWLELTFALHDAGVLDKSTVSERIRKLADRSELNLTDTVRSTLRRYATGIDSVADVDAEEEAADREKPRESND